MRYIFTLILAPIFCALGLFAPTAMAQPFPAKPITLIVPWPAGGPTDRHLRLMAELAGNHLGQPVLVENKPGAGGTLGPSTMAASARPDGYTIAQFPLGMLRYPHMQKTAWHPIHDFTFIAGLSGYTFGLVVKADSPFHTMQDYLAAAQGRPGSVDYGSAGIGTSAHLLIEELALAARVRLNHVPYKGNPDMMQALLGGHVMSASDASGWDKYVDSGQLRLLLTFGDRPSRRWPGVPTAKSLGYDVVSNSPYGIVGPKGMDPAVVKVLQDAFRKATADPRNEAMLEQLNQEAWSLGSEEFRAWAVQTFDKEKRLIERLGLSARDKP